MRVLGALLCGLAIVLTPPGAAAADASISIRGNDFVPGQVTVTAGETVTWTHNDGQAGHNVSLPGVFRSPGMYEGGTFAFTFNEPGTYAYGCSLHPTLMTGSVVVLGQTAEPPTVAPAPTAVVGPAQGGPTMATSPATATATATSTVAPAAPSPAVVATTTRPVARAATPLPVLPPATGPAEGVDEGAPSWTVIFVCATAVAAAGALMSWRRRGRAR